MTDQASTLPTARLADVWRNPDDPRWAEAAQRMNDIVGRAVRRHSLVKRAPREDREDLVQELIAGFWMHLVQNRAALEASRVHSEGAIYTEALRFVDNEGPKSGGDERERLRLHLRDKVRTALGSDSRFSCHRFLWMLSAWFNEQDGGNAGDRGAAKSDRQVLAQLPQLEAQLRPQRKGQLPSLVRASELPPFLEECFELGGKPRTAWDLTNFTWKSLVPPPETVLELVPLETASPEAVVIHGEWCCEVDIVAGAFIDGLGRRTAIVAQMQLKKQSCRNIGSVLEISRSTVSSEWQKFKSLFEDVVRQKQLGEDEARSFLRAVLDILEVEPFSIRQGEAER